MKQKAVNRKLFNILVYALYFSFCLITSYSIAAALGYRQQAALQTIPFVICFALCLGLQNIIHTLGHWLFGRFSGMQLIAITFLKQTHVKEGKVFQTRQELPEGLFSSCIMAYPPEKPVQKKASYSLYWLGGMLLNLFTSLIALLLILVGEWSIGTVAGCFCFSMFASGLGYAVMNGLPMYRGGMPNDCLMAWQMHRNPKVRQAFAMNMRLLALLSQESPQMLEKAEPYLTPEWQNENTKDTTFHVTKAGLWLRQYEFHMWQGHRQEAEICLQLLWEQRSFLPDTWQLRLEQECVFWLSLQQKEIAFLASFMTPERIRRYEEQGSAEAWRCIAAWLQANQEKAETVQKYRKLARESARQIAFRPAAEAWKQLV